jgi:3'(2'), 5'-bisphosphate nucleotidase
MRKLPTFEVLNIWANKLVPVVDAAAAAIMDVYVRDFAVMEKADASPVTEADRAAEAIVLAGLHGLNAGFPIVAEELVEAEGAPTFDGNSFWLVDALDGTREFIKRGTEFTVNVGLIYEGLPILGLIQIPAQGITYIGICAPSGQRRAEKLVNKASSPIAVRRCGPSVIIAGSRSHEIEDEIKAFLATKTVGERLIVGSSLKFCMVAEGKADFYPRFGPTCEWDTAAGHALVRAAGGSVHTFDGTEMRYKKPHFRNGRYLAQGLPEVSP